MTQAREVEILPFDGDLARAPCVACGGRDSCVSVVEQHWRARIGLTLS